MYLFDVRGLNTGLAKDISSIPGDVCGKLVGGIVHPSDCFTPISPPLVSHVTASTNTGCTMTFSFQGPWDRCDTFNGSMLFLLQLRGFAPRTDSGTGLRLVCIAPVVLGILFTWWMERLSRKIIRDTSSPDLASSNHMGIQCLEACYLIMEGAILVAGLTTQIEIQFKVWGVVSVIPLTVLFIMSRDVDLRRNHRSVLNLPGRIFQSIVLHSATPMILAVVASVLIVWSPSITVSRDSEEPSDSPLLYILVVPGVVMLSTPVFGGGPSMHNRTLTSAMSGAWYAVLLLLLDEIPSLTSWFGMPLLVLCLTRIIGSFKAWSFDLQVAWSLASVLVGLLISGTSGWWSRLIIICVVGTMKMVLTVSYTYYNVLYYNGSKRVSTKSNDSKQSDILTPLLVLPYNSSTALHQYAHNNNPSHLHATKDVQDLKCMMFRLSGRM